MRMGPLRSVPASTAETPAARPPTAAPAAEPATGGGRSRRPAIVAQAARRHHEARMETPVGADHPTCARIGIEPSYAAFGSQPFDAIVPPAIRIRIRSLGIEKAAGPVAADAWQDSIERLDIVAIRRRATLLRRGRRSQCQQRDNQAEENTPEHRLFLSLS